MKQLLILAGLLPALDLAELEPPPGPLDPRVRVVQYQPAQVVRITTAYGVASHIQFALHETIRDVAIGDEQAWHIVPRGAHLFLKPKARKADTNLTVVTDRRVYHFALVVGPRKPDDPTAWRGAGLVYSLSFNYPDDDAYRLAAQSQADADKARQDDLEDRLAAARRGEGGHDYWVAGSEEISPTSARDDGRFIYLSFSRNRDMPAVYAVDAHGQESLVNTHVEGNQIVVHRLVRQLTLRKGDAVACLVNKSFDLDGGTDNRTGTVAPDVERVIKGAP